MGTTNPWPKSRRTKKIPIPDTATLSSFSPSWASLEALVATAGFASKFWPEGQSAPRERSGE
eukprot:8681511-Pyramimonas_sp.AAC.1